MAVDETGPVCFRCIELLVILLKYFGLLWLFFPPGDTFAVLRLCVCLPLRLATTEILSRHPSHCWGNVKKRVLHSQKAMVTLVLGLIKSGRLRDNSLRGIDISCALFCGNVKTKRIFWLTAGALCKRMNVDEKWSHHTGCRADWFIHILCFAKRNQNHGMNDITNRGKRFLLPVPGKTDPKIAVLVMHETLRSPCALSVIKAIASAQPRGWNCSRWTQTCCASRN